MDAALAVIGGRWKGSILWRLSVEGPMRPGALRRRIPGVSEGVLLRQLAELVDDGILERLDAGQLPLRVTYGLTAYGASLGPVMTELCRWGAAHSARPR